MNRKHIIPSLLLAAAIPLNSLAQATETVPEGYKLVWQDDFNGSALDEKAWNIEVNGDGGGNQEMQFYRRDNVSVTDGNLVLTARREDYSGKKFTSGRINSRNKAAFKHGIMQARVKIPKTANGLWPAYWMMGNDYAQSGWPRCGEMDILEMGHFNGINNGTQDRYFAGTLHYGKSASNEDHQQYSMDFTAPAENPVENDEYHIFTVEWDGNNLNMYYDLEGYKAAQKRRARYFTQGITASEEVNSPGKYFQKPFFFIFNLAVGGSFTNIYNPNAITALPNPGDEAKMLVDWVRVYQAEDDADAQYLTPDGTNIQAEPEPVLPEDTKTEFGYYGKAALDANGQTTFDFSKASDAVLIGTSQGVTEALSASTTANYNVDDTKNFLYVWSDTYSNMPSQGKNSFGFEEDYSHYIVNSVGWSGLGYASSAGNGKDLSMINDDYILHFAMRGIDADKHVSHEITVGSAKFSLGLASVEGTPLLGDFKRDGSWTSFDIPVKVLKTLAGGDLFTTDHGPSAYEGNVFAILSGGVAGSDLQFDNVFFYKNPDINKNLPTVDNTTPIGKYAQKAIADGTSTFNLSDAKDVVLIGTSQGVTEALSGVTLKNYNVDDTRNFFWIWDGGDYQGMPSDGLNSFGWAESWTRLQVGDGSWNGAGYASEVGKGKDLSMIDNSYYLHFAMKGNDVLTHPSQTITVGKAVFVIGNATKDAQILGDYRRDGEWYNFDIPVAKLQQLAGGTLFDNAASYEGNTFAVSTTNTKGAEVNFDNVFFYKKASSPDPIALPDYVTQALDADNKTTFDIADAQDVVLIGTSLGVTEGFNGRILKDYNVDDVNNFLYVWDGTYTSNTPEGVNSFGYAEPYSYYKVGTAGWSGLGYASPAGKGKDLSMLDDTYYLHFAMKGTAREAHLVEIGNAKLGIGDFNDNGTVTRSFANYTRDGKWYNFDIPFAEIRSLATVVFDNPTNYSGNVFATLSGGNTNTEIQFDNIFFYRKTSELAANGISLTQSQSVSTANTEVALGVFDLSGRKVAESVKGAQLPQGLYILRTATGTKKVVIRR
ncbi:MAG: family 16 glycosylhydrolase [Prevotella sp.]|nr:family 16 glycosylhydrolase [Prevotella sp.]